MKAQGRWKWRAVDAEENQLQVSLSAPRPWKSLRDFHIPTV
jgi:transposase-like protein